MARDLMLRKALTSGFHARILLLLLVVAPTRAANVTSTLMVGDSRIDITINTDDAPLLQTDVMKWVQSATESVTAYYGRFPVPHYTLRINGFEGAGVKHGTTWSRMGGMTRIYVGSKTSAEDFADDWMMTHEMLHLAFPSMMGDDHHWIEEGLAVYVEPIARIRAGHWTARQMWSELVRDMPKGQPQDGDEGLDHTHTWGRTYWGGALFCFVADVEIRRKTKNKKGLEDALRGILESGGDIGEDWPIEKTLKTGDQAIGLDVLEKLYAEWKDKPVQVDLAAMWKELGIDASGGTLKLKDDAPLSAVRHALEMGSSAAKPAKSAARSGGSSSKNSQAASNRPLAIFVGRTARSK